MDLLDDFVTATQHLRSPPLFRRWAGVGMVSAALNRTVYTSVAPGKFLWPNTNIMLVAEPHKGKSEAIDAAKAVLREHVEVAMGPNSMTIEKGLKLMGEHFAKPDNDGDVLPLSFALVNDELGTLFKKWEPQHFQMLASLWDIQRKADVWEHSTVTGVNAKLYNPYITLLSGAQPMWLATALPPQSFDLGLPSRFIFVYADKRVSRREAGPHEEWRLAQVQKNLHRISRVEGYVPLDPETRAAFEAWEDDDMQPAPDDPMLRHYAGRRNMHAGKIALIVAMSRHPEDRTIHMPDLQTAWDMLHEVEAEMAKSFMYVGGNPYRPAEMQAVDAVRKLYSETGQPVPEAVVLGKIGRSVPTHLAKYSLEQLVATRQIARVQGGFKPVDSA